MDPNSWYLIIASAFGLLMAWGVGANDVANAMGTSVGSGALTLRQAIVIAIIFEFLGAFLAGGQVTDTIRKGIIDTNLLDGSVDIFVIGMMSSLLAAGCWLAVATYFGWPVSTSHTIVGALIGFGVAHIGPHAVQWEGVGRIALSWIVSPILGGFLGFTIFMSVQKLILTSKSPFAKAKKIVPLYMFLVGWIVSLVTLVSGLKHIGLDISAYLSVVLSIAFGLFTTLIGIHLLNRIKLDPNADLSFHFASVERIFGVLMLFTACAMAFAHGSNDVANAIGPLAAVAHALNTGEVASSSPIPIWILLLGSLGIVAGLMTYGHKVIATIGTGITELTPSKGFAATLAAAITVVLASGTGLPISTTHTLVGAVLGVGLARGINALNMMVIRKIFMSWIVTLPAGALLAIVFFEVISSLLNIPVFTAH